MEAVHTGAPIAFEGEYYDIAIQGFQLPNRPFRERIPIFAAAMGPGMVRAMSEVCGRSARPNDAFTAMGE